MRLLKLVPDNTNIHFLKWQWPTTIVSVAADDRQLGAGGSRKGLNYGVDFVGGQMIRVTFTQSRGGAGRRSCAARSTSSAMASR